MPPQDPKAPAAPGRPGHSRRDFLRGSGLAAAGVALAGSAESALHEAGADVVQTEGVAIYSGSCPIELKVNGEAMSVTVEPRSTLLDTLRNRLDVTGPKRVCDRASCGACTVILDGEAVYSCTTLAISCTGHEVRTLESFETGEGSVPHAFHQNDGLMCGYCTPGFVTACQAWLERNPGQEPTLDDIKQGLDGNICRCGTYIGVFQAALDAAKAMKNGRS
ncbi:(2Fe-2S)-binding protein [Tautonia sociabilis]|uniref:(2Fe-2S)-binding protein n=1 Tax=Tautonia sociabilis TaxID=2080755 RepID=A0A432MK89_9BACT|nr:(2Fe-2S)-binding protein [Tautonia sociabilis]RUL87823.1 (2Fe-2S)-binding protein [Tautonia sociabilis]